MSELDLFQFDEKYISALPEYSSDNFIECLDNLKKIKLPTEQQVNHIKHMDAVSAFCKGGHRDVKALETVLDDIIGDLGDENQPLEIKTDGAWIAYYDKAVILYHSRKQSEALRVLIALLHHLDELNVGIAKRVCLLTVEILLNTHQTKRSELVLAEMEKRLNTTISEIIHSDENEEDVDSLLENDKNDHRVLTSKSLDSFESMVRYIMLLVKVVGGQTVLIPNEMSVEMLVLKAQDFYQRRDFQMAAKELAKKPDASTPTARDNGEEYDTLIANNMGLIHFHVRHYAMAARFFQHAITFDQDAFKALGNDPPLYSMNAYRQPEILYNLGIALLHLQRPQDAFDCLIVTAQIYTKNPRLWLRLAEACIMTHKQNSTEQRNLMKSVPGPIRKYIISPAPSRCIANNNTNPESKPTLAYANVCLRNALTLLEQYKEIIVNSNEEIESTFAAETTPKQFDKCFENQICAPSRRITKESFENLKCAILAASSYVDIDLCDFESGLKHARELRSIPNLPDTYAMLANIYCAEALIMLDRPSEARVYLDPNFIGLLKEDDLLLRGSPDWNVGSLDAAQCVMRYNLAVLLVLNDDLEGAQKVIAMCTHPLVFNQMKILRMFIELEAGKYGNFHHLIQTDGPQH